MSRENVRLVERAIAAINARDIESYRACCTEDVKLETPMAAVGGVYEGIDGIRRFLTDVEEATPDFRMELDGVEEVDSKRVIAFLRNHSTGPAAFAWHGLSSDERARNRLKSVCWSGIAAKPTRGLEPRTPSLRVKCSTS